MAGAVAWPTLRYAEDRRTLGFFGTWLGLVVTQWVWTPPNVVVSVLLWCATCVFCFVGAVSTHNVIHCPMFKEARYNEAWRLLQTLWYGQPVSLFVPVHNHSHHKHVQTRQDLTRSTKARHTWQLLNLFVGSAWQRAAARDCKAYFDAQRAKGARVWKQFVRERNLLVGVGVVLLVIDWKSALLFVVLPQQVGAFCIRAINFMQHDGCDYDASGYDHSRNFVSTAFNWLMLNNGYHTIHHMRPGVHWSLLPQQHAELVHGHIHPALEVPSVARWFAHHIVWPGRRVRFDGGAWEDQPGGEGPDLPWDFSVAALYQTATTPGEAPLRRTG